VKVLHPEMFQLGQIPLQGIVDPFFKENKVGYLGVTFLLERLDELLWRLLIGQQISHSRVNTHINSVDAIDLTALYTLINECQVANTWQAERASTAEHMMAKRIELNTLQIREPIMLHGERRRSKQSI
jgi:hypothetical protein